MGAKSVIEVTGPEALRALRACHASKIDVRFGDALADPPIFDRAIAHARHALLMQFVIEERSIIGDHDQQRNAVVRRGPQRGDAHQEVAVATDGDRQPAAVFKRQRSANRNARAAADASATIGTEIVEGMTNAQFAPFHDSETWVRLNGPLADRLPQRHGKVIDSELVARERRETSFARAAARERDRDQALRVTLAPRRPARTQ